VLCAGAWTRALLAPHGVGLRLEVAAPRQQLLAMPPAPPGARVPDPVELVPPGVPLVDTALRPVHGGAARPAAHPVVLDLEHGFAARCEPELARTRVASLDLAGMPRLDDPDDLDEGLDPAFAAWARGAAARRLPAYRDAADRGQIAGWYTLTPDDRPLIGPLAEIEGLWIVAGFNGHGFKLAPSIGEGVARMLCGEPAGTFDETAFAPQRFAVNREGTPALGFGL
jgi:glycine/D-amino acid oxidase-like deaminating enzyme